MAYFSNPTTPLPDESEKRPPTAEEFQRGVDLGYFWTSRPPTPPKEMLDFFRQPAKVIPHSKLSEQVGRKLNLRGVEESHIFRLRTDADLLFHQADKRARFYEWLRRNMGIEGKLLGKCEKPGFVGSSSEIRKILLTKMFPEYDWAFYAVKVNGVVFLKSCEDDVKKTSVNGSVIFKRIALGQDPVAVGLNQFQEPAVISQFSVGTPKDVLLLHCPNVCYDDEGNKVMVRSDAEWFNENVRKKRCLEAWADAVVSGVERVVMGHRGKKEVLTSVDLLTLDQLWEGGGRGKEEMQGCFRFLQDVLDRIKMELRYCLPKSFKKFQWDPKDKELSCKEVEGRELQVAEKRIWVDWSQENVFQA